MIRALLFVLGFMVFSCSTSSHQEENTTTQQEETQVQTTTPDPEVALAFINSYVEFSSNFEADMSMEDWVNNQTNVSEDFKSELARILSEAEKEDPELGLGFDPIYNAQEFPDEGFVLGNVDGEYVRVKGKAEGWDIFQVTIKLKNEVGKWLVDGAGIINIPEDKIIYQ